MKKQLFKLLFAILLFFGITPSVLAQETEFLAEEETYTVTVNAYHNYSRLSNVAVMISQNNQTVTYGTTNYNGKVTFDLPNGTYTAIIGFVSGNYSYYGTADFTVNGANISVNVNVDSEFTKDAAKKVYDKTSYFDHVDIRVNGTLTTGTTGNTTTHNVTIRNVELLVKNGGRTLIDTTFTDNRETYEWRVTRVNIPKTAVVSLIFDILVDGVTVRENYEYSFSGEEAFIQAIINCDNNQGLDFKIDPTEIVEAAFYDVKYEWTGLPEGLTNLPSLTDGYASGDMHTVDTQYKEGIVIVDEVNGKAYTFSGWEEWSNASDNHNVKTDITGSEVNITHDTIIYGVWTSTDLAYAESHLILKKNFSGNNGITPNSLYFAVQAPSGQIVEVSYSAFVNGEYSLPLYESGDYIITEYNTNVLGYNFTSAQISSTLPVKTTGATTITVTVDLNYVTPGSGSSTSEYVGTVTFINNYAKKYGTAIYNYPTLSIEKADSVDRTALSGAVFTLTPTKVGASPIVSLATDESGYTVFKDLQPGTYILTETTSPSGYYKSEEEHTVVVEAKSPVEVYDAGQDAYVLVYDYIVTITPSEHYNGQDLRLTIYNEKITGTLTIVKEFATDSILNKTNFTGTINVLVTGVNNYSKVVTLNNSNNWTVTLSGLELGKYTIQEVLSDAKVLGYDLEILYGTSKVASFEVELGVTDKEESVTITNKYVQKIQNNYEDASLKINKIDNKNEALSGVKFGLFDKNDNLVLEAITDNNGVIVFSGLNEAGTYTLKEISVPEGYKKSNKEWTVVVALENENPTPTLDGANDTFVKDYKYVVTSTDTEFVNGEFTIVNEKLTGSLVITKEVVYTKDGKEVTKPENFVDEVYTFIVVIGNDEQEITLKAGESKTFDNIEYGTTYSVVEVIPSDAIWAHVAPNNGTGVIELRETKVNLINTYEIVEVTNPEGPYGDVTSGDSNIPNTGLENNSLLYSIITTIGILGLAVTFVSYKKFN